MRTGIGIAVVVAIGLIWSVAVMSQWVPVASPEINRSHKFKITMPMLRDLYAKPRNPTINGCSESKAVAHNNS